jgi:hypothetical protein
MFCRDLAAEGFVDGILVECSPAGLIGIFLGALLDGRLKLGCCRGR